MSESSILAVQSQADGLGITFQKQQCLEELAQDAEYRVTQFLKQIILLKNKTNSQKLTCDHVKVISDRYYHKPIIGYFSDSNYEMQEESTDGSVFAFVKQPKIPLKQIVSSTLPPPNREMPFEFRWKKINGVNFDSASAKTRLQSKVMKSATNPLTSIYDSHQDQQTLKPLSSTLQQYYSEAVEIITKELVDFFKPSFNTIKLSVGIGPTVPYFLRFFMSQIATNLDNPIRMAGVGGAALALVKNKTLPISLFAHPFMKIGFTLLLKQTMSGNDVKADIEIRELGANIILCLIDNCSAGYPGMKTEVINKLSVDLFVPNQLFSLIYGCLFVLLNLDDDSFIKMLPHTRFIYKLAQNEKENPYANETIRLIKESIDQFKLAHQRCSPALESVLNSF